MTADKASNTRDDSAQQAKSVKIWFPTYIGEFFTACAGMTGHEVGAYQLIIASLWKAGGSIPADDRSLAKLARATPRQWKEIKQTLWPLFEIKAGFLTHPDTSAEIAKAEAMVAKKSDAAKARWASKRNADAMHVHSRRNADGMTRACEGEGEGPYQGKDFIDNLGADTFRVIGGGK